MENYTPEWWNKGELADVVRRSRLVTVEAHGVYLESIECRHRAAVLRDEAQRCELHHEVLVELGLEGEVEGLEGLADRQP